MGDEGWESLYKEKGEIYADILPQVSKCAKIFKKRGYSKILDLGCGTGRHSVFLAQKGFNVYAADISKTGVAITKNKAKALKLSMSYGVFDMKKIPYPAKYFDVVICILNLGHGLLKDNKRTIDEVYRVLKPKGMFVTEFMSVKDKTYGRGKEVEKNTFLGSMEEDKHMLHHYFTRDEIKRLLSNFSEVKISAKDYWGQVKAFDVEAVK